MAGVAMPRGVTAPQLRVTLVHPLRYEARSWKTDFARRKPTLHCKHWQRTVNALPDTAARISSASAALQPEFPVH